MDLATEVPVAALQGQQVPARGRARASQETEDTAQDRAAVFQAEDMAQDRAAVFQAEDTAQDQVAVVRAEDTAQDQVVVELVPVVRAEMAQAPVGGPAVAAAAARALFRVW
jgi:hypothetical protein